MAYMEGSQFLETHGPGQTKQNLLLQLPSTRPREQEPWPPSLTFTHCSGWYLLHVHSVSGLSQVLGKRGVTALSCGREGAEV